MKTTAVDKINLASDKIIKAVPEHINGRHVVATAVMAIKNDKYLSKLEPNTALVAVCRAAMLGLECNSPLGQAYIVPFWNSKLNAYEAQLIPGYRGFITLATNSGHVRAIQPGEIFSNDEWAIIDGVVSHRVTSLNDRGDFEASYATATLTDGTKVSRFLNRADIEKIKKFSKAKKGPWFDWEEEMRMKSAVRRLYKILPATVERSQILGIDNAAEQGIPTSRQPVNDVIDVVGEVYEAPEEPAPVEESQTRVHVDF